MVKKGVGSNADLCTNTSLPPPDALLDVIECRPRFLFGHIGDGEGQEQIGGRVVGRWIVGQHLRDFVQQRIVEVPAAHDQFQDPRIKPGVTVCRPSSHLDGRVDRLPALDVLIEAKDR